MTEAVVTRAQDLYRTLFDTTLGKAFKLDDDLQEKDGEALHILEAVGLLVVHRMGGQALGAIRHKNGLEDVFLDKFPVKSIFGGLWELARGKVAQIRIPGVKDSPAIESVRDRIRRSLRQGRIASGGKRARPAAERDEDEPPTKRQEHAEEPTEEEEGEIAERMARATGMDEDRCGALLDLVTPLGTMDEVKRVAGAAGYSAQEINAVVQFDTDVLVEFIDRQEHVSDEFCRWLDWMWSKGVPLFTTNVRAAFRIMTRAPHFFKRMVARNAETNPRAVSILLRAMARDVETEKE